MSFATATRRAVLPVEAVLCLITLTLLALAPPARGEMLVLSLAGEPPAAILGWAMRAGARPARAGPLPNSIILIGDRARLGPAALASGSILIAAHEAYCGKA